LRDAHAALIFFFFSFSIVGISAIVYEQAAQTITQTIVNVVNINLDNVDLGTINEGETRFITKEDVPSLGDAITVEVDESVPLVNVNLDSNLDELAAIYSVFDVIVRFSQVVGESHSVGDVACVLSIGSDDFSSIELDESGTWKLDFEVVTSAKSVDVDKTSAITLVVSAEEG
jgi:hypothetical protein